ncbi:unnamed protein product [Thelazia callipaeda]|uniref:C-type lectin domain-containing protein n=1 Tax=Thelazia callipaeda TaxID=103827 RepID=A0A0N5D6H1_THECL|nr:unnamed protein product [Thelazia callipaeda]
MFILVAMCRSVCDPGWRFSPHSKKCYKFFNRAISWAQAEFNCLYLGGHHLSIHSLNENRFTREIAHDASELWLGSAQFHHSDKYEWSDHTRFDFENWKNDVRPNNNWNQPCTKMNITTGEWFPSCCRKLAPYICQKNPRTTTLYIDSEEVRMKI